MSYKSTANYFLMRYKVSEIKKHITGVNRVSRIMEDATLAEIETNPSNPNYNKETNQNIINIIRTQNEARLNIIKSLLDGNIPDFDKD